MPLTSANFPTLIEPGMDEVFFSTYDRVDRGSLIPVLYKVGRSDKNTEDFHSMTGFSGEIAVMTGGVTYHEIEEGYGKTFTHDQFADGFQVARALRDDDMYNVINRLPAKLALKYWNKRETDAASIFNSCTSDTGPDTTALCNTSHPSPISGIAVRSNYLSNATTGLLNHDNLHSVARLLQLQTDDTGAYLNLNADDILVPPALDDTAWRIVNSALRPDTADNDANINQNRFTVHVWKKLTDTNRWFVMDREIRKQSLLWFDRVPVEFRNVEDFDSIVEKYRAYMRYSKGYIDWPWIYGAQPS